MQKPNNKQKIKVLFLAPRLPLPADTGGKIRTLNILQQVAQRMDVHLVCFSFAEQDQKLAEPLRQQGMAVTMVPLQEAGIAAKALSVIFGQIPYSIKKYDSPAMQAALKKLMNEDPCDIIHIDHLHMSHYRECFNGKPVMLDEHNVEFKILERCSDVENTFWKKQIYRTQAKKMRSFETRMAKRFSHCFTVSEDDRALLNNLISKEAPVDVIANGVDTEYFLPAPLHPVPGTRSQHPSLVFTGSMDWLPNHDAVIYFCNEILPLVWKSQPDLQFYVVGKSPSREVTALGQKDPRIVVTGRVDDVRPFMAAAQIFVVPIRVGGGTRLKILEAMSMQKVVISTRIGAEGISYTEGKNIFIADTPQAFADKILATVKDEKVQAQIGTAAREFVQSHYDWKIIGNRLEEIYARYITKR